MLNLTLKNIPKKFHARLKESAEKNRRGLNSDILTRLAAQFSAPVVDVEAHARLLRQLVARLPRVDHRIGNRAKRKGLK